MRKLLGILALVTMVLPALAIDTERAFEDPELQARYEEIISEVRCLKCQNQTLKDSNAFLASDLRREIRLMIEEGLSNDEIYDFLVERYGEFALYRPRTSGKTLILWIAPGALLLGGIIFLAGILRKRMSMPIDEDGA
jgi:cytochrome c-type biogenesis protein CcmH